MKQESNSLEKTGRWTPKEHRAFLEGVKLYGRNWSKVAELVETRTAVQVRSHAQKYELRERATKQLPPKPVQPQPYMVDRAVQYGEGVIFGLPSISQSGMDFGLAFS